MPPGFNGAARLKAKLLAGLAAEVAGGILGAWLGWANRSAACGRRCSNHHHPWISLPPLQELLSVRISVAISRMGG